MFSVTGKTFIMKLLKSRENVCAAIDQPCKPNAKKYENVCCSMLACEKDICVKGFKSLGEKCSYRAEKNECGLGYICTHKIIANIYTCKIKDSYGIKCLGDKDCSNYSCRPFALKIGGTIKDMSHFCSNSLDDKVIFKGIVYSRT